MEQEAEVKKICKKCKVENNECVCKKKRSDAGKSKMTSWSRFVKQYQEKHNVLYSVALSECSKLWKGMSQDEKDRYKSDTPVVEEPKKKKDKKKKKEKLVGVEEEEEEAEPIKQKKQKKKKNKVNTKITEPENLSEEEEELVKEKPREKRKSRKTKRLVEE